MIAPPVSLLADATSDLNGLKQGDRDEALRRVAQEFEAMFTRTLLKSAHVTAFGSGKDDMPSLGGSELYRDLQESQVARAIARGRGLGLADMIVRSLGGKPETPSSAPVSGARTAAITAPDATWRAGSAHEFVAQLLPYAKQVAERLGIQPAFVLAQSALETGWGSSVPTRANGASAFNFFGIKAGSDWGGEKTVVPTLEWRDGALERSRESFRAYRSPQDSFADYAGLLEGDARYRAALAEAGDPRALARSLSAAGYATDPEYADKLISILDGDRLAGALAHAQGTTH